MKDIEVISREHQQLFRTIDEVNDAVIVLKRDYLFQSDKVKFADLSCTEEIIAEGKSRLVSFLDQLIGKRSEDDGPDLPEKLLKKIRDQFPDLRKLNKQFKGIKKIIEENSDMSEEHFVVLDRIVTELDMERSKLLKN